MNLSKLASGLPTSNWAVDPGAYLKHIYSFYTYRILNTIPSLFLFKFFFTYLFT
jgi:hypothetical protein